MDFAFDEQQLDFRDQLRAFTDKRCTPADVRAAWASDTGWSPQRLRELGELGVLGVAVPADLGGLGLGLVDLALLLEEAGRSGLPEPLLETAAVGAPLVERLPGDAGAAVRSRWMSAVVAGEAAVGVAAPGLETLVRAGSALGLVMVDGELHAVEVDAAASGTAGHRHRRSIDTSRRLLDLASSVSGTTRVAAAEETGDLWHSAADRGAWAAAAVLVGVADRLLATAADYARQRVQFGRPIGSFQAVKHHLAGASVRLEFARPLVHRAAWSIDEEDPERSVHVSMAKASASEAALGAASVALQVHGAIGYTWEHDLHLWMKKTWSLAGAWGDAGWHRARVLGLVDW